MPFPLIPMMLGGAAIGGLLDKDNPLKGAALGAGLGAGGAAIAPNVFAGGGLTGASGIGSQAAAAASPFGPEAALAGVAEMPAVASPMVSGTPGGLLTQSGYEGGLNVAQQTLGDRAKSLTAQAQAVLPPITPGFKQNLQTGAGELGKGLLRNADKFDQPQDKTPPPSPGSLSHPQAPMPDNIFMKFNRRRR